jgi:chromate transporter
MPQKKITLRDLFFTFAKIGSMTFGGGYAMLPVAERELIDKRGWTTSKELIDFYAVAQATPGVIAVNVATLIGWRKGGFAGSVAATLGLVAPSVIVITAIASFLGLWAEAEIALRISAALRICVAALIINAVIPFFKRGVMSLFTLALFILGFCAFMFLGVSPALIVAFSAISGIFYDFAKGRFK